MGSPRIHTGYSSRTLSRIMRWFLKAMSVTVVVQLFTAVSAFGLQPDPSLD